MTPLLRSLCCRRHAYRSFFHAVASLQQWFEPVISTLDFYALHALLADHGDHPSVTA